MLVQDFMDHFVEQSEAIGQAISDAIEELNGVVLPADVGPLRLSFAEIENIVMSACGIDFGANADLSDEERRDEAIIAEGLEELTTQFFLRQFPETMDEAMAAFHVDLVTLLRHNPLLMGHIQPIMARLKVRTSTGLSRQKKFTEVISLVQAAIDAMEAADEEYPDYAFRILDEIADFGDCLLLPTDTGSGVCPTAVNDNEPKS